MQDQTNCKANEASSDVSYVKVHIHDKLSKLEEIYEQEAISGAFIHNGKAVENMGDVTFAKM